MFEECVISQDKRSDLSQSVIFFGVGNLFNILGSINNIQDKNLRMLACDGTYKILKDKDRVLITLGSIIVDVSSSSLSQNKVKRQFCVLTYQAI